MKNPFSASHYTGLVITAGALVLVAGPAAAGLLNFPSVPLLISNSVPPNLMLMLDSSGSMNNVAPPSIYDPAQTQAQCPAANLVSTDRQVELYVGDSTTGEARIAESFTRLTHPLDPDESAPSNRPPAPIVDQVFEWGRGAGQKCFSPDSNAKYFARLIVPPAPRRSADIVNGVTYLTPTGFRAVAYTGHFLNWYFNPDNTSRKWDGGETSKPLDRTSLAVSRNAVMTTSAKALVEGLDVRLRVGLSSYNGADGGSLIVPVAALNPAQRLRLADEVSAIPAEGDTPLAETLAGIGRYFTTRYGLGSPLMLHPDADRQSVPVNQVFLKSLKGAESVSDPPINLSCQQSFVALLTDGRPNHDQNGAERSPAGQSAGEAKILGDSLLDYDGDCSGANAGNCDSFDEKKNPSYSYEFLGSDYLDDVAQALYEIDLRPDFPNESLSGMQYKNNIVTHIIGFADEDVVDDQLIKDTVKNGHGGFFLARNAADLRDAFAQIVTNVLDRAGGFSAVALSTTILNESTRVFQSRFNSKDWSGDLSSTPISNGPVGGSCPGVATGSLCRLEWSAAAKLDAQSADSRVILTQKPSNGVGIPFRWSSLDASQKILLAIKFDPLTNTATADTRGEDRLNYIRGDRSLEGPENFRVRSTRLGDIIDSDPVFVGAPSQAYPLPGYAAFRAAQSGRQRMVYVGANDGMLHGFSVADGREMLAYVPDYLFGRAADPKLAKLTSDPYIHTWGVDGSPVVGDIQVGGGDSAADWRSYLVGTLQYGGQGLFALDVTNPASFSDSNAPSIVKWEFTDTNSGVEGRDLGRTFSKPFIVKMKNGKWAAIIGNGYNNSESDGNVSATGQAALFIIFMDGPGADGIWSAGTEYIKLAVPGGSVITPNGLATAAPVDIDGDSLIDYIYGGDLLGNLWQFNVNSADPATWKVGYNTQPLFVARDYTGTPQPITATPEVGLNLLTADDPDDLIVYFGTGQFIALGDNSATGQQNQSFYGIFANPIASPPPAFSETSASPAANRTNLLKQSVLQETEVNGNHVRISSNLPIDLTKDKGWFIDLYNTQGGTSDASAAAGANKGERQVTRPVLRNGRIVFTTLIPSSDPCDFGGGGFLMEVDAQTGSRPARPALDVTNNITVDENDLVSANIEGNQGNDGKIAVSGIGAETGILSQPAILAIPPNKEIKLVGTSTGDVETFGEATNTRRGRITWREINP